MPRVTQLAEEQALETITSSSTSFDLSRAVKYVENAISLPPWVYTAASGLCDIWIEAMLVALAVHIYLRFLRYSRGKSSAKNRQQKKAPPMPPSVPEKPQESQEQKEATIEHPDLQLLVTDLQRKGGALGQSALEKYEDLIRTQRLDLREYFDSDTARAFFLALTESATVGGHRSSKTTTARLLADMRVFGFTRDHDFYSEVLKHLVAAKLNEDCLWLHDVMLSDGVAPDRTMYISLLTAAVSCQNDARAIAFFKEASKSGVAPMRTYMTVLRVYARSQDTRAAVELLSGLREAGGAPDALVLNTVLDICVSGNALGRAEALLKQWATVADVVSCNIVLKGYSQQGKLLEAERLLDCMLAKGPAPSTVTFNTVMDCAVRELQVSSGDKWQRARRNSPSAAAKARPWTLLDQLLEAGLEPDKYTASTLVKGLHLVGCSAEGIDRATALVRRIGHRGLDSAVSEHQNARLPEVIFNSLLDACASISDLDRMGEIFEMMGQFQVTVSAVTFGTLIKAFGQAGKLALCHEVWQNMLDAQVVPTVVTYGCYIDVCFRNKDVAAAESVFERMVKSGSRPNEVINTSMVRGYTNSGQSFKALELYRRLREEGADANASTYNSVLDALVRQLADGTKLQEVLDDMKSSSVPPDVVTYSILIKACCNAGQLQKALALFRQLRAHGLAFDEVAFNTLLLACSKADSLDEAEEILAEMHAIGMAPTAVTVSILVKMYGKAKMLDKAMALSEMVEREYGVVANLHIYTCLIQACIRNKQVRQSWVVFARMLRSGVAPDAVTYGTVIHGCVYNGKFEQALALVRHAYAVSSTRALLKSLNISDLVEEKNMPGMTLQADVLQALASALKRKGQQALLTELEEIALKN